jgi:hypothetical protein
MKKVFFPAFFALLVATNLSAQRLPKKTAKELMEKCFTSLQTSDTVAFVSLWQPNDSPWPYHERPFTKKELISTFIQMQQFLDTALTENMALYSFDVERADSVVGTRYTIRVWFKYNPYYYKGYGLHVDYIGDKWVCRFYPDTSYIIRPRKS